ncbi:MAG TPA: SDR family oxidoreductase, partial [Reyranellaceae bacterium]|nr:SDR family oxidoreductase [Reyranellaceae bacterium]
MTMPSDRTRVLVLGASGMLGSAAYRVFGEDDRFEVIGAARSEAVRRYLPEGGRRSLITGVEATAEDSLVRALAETRPDVVINCIGVIKQLQAANDPLITLPINALLPHRLAALCRLAGARLVHISTDCVFSGAKGGYTEEDTPDATDLYGLSKLLGEVAAPHAITLRTSLIGPELGGGGNGLVGWFLNQSGRVRGFRKAVFSGLPTVSLARLMRDVVIPNPSLSGVFHVGAEPINKLDLLTLVRDAWGKEIEITP